MAHITFLARLNEGFENQVDLFRVWTRDRSVGDRSSRAILDISINTAPSDDGNDRRTIAVGAVDAVGPFLDTKGHVPLQDKGDKGLRVNKGDIASYLTNERLLALVGRVYAPTAPTFTEPKPSAPASVDPEWNDEDEDNNYFED